MRFAVKLNGSPAEYSVKFTVLTESEGASGSERSLAARTHETAHSLLCRSGSPSPLSSVIHQPLAPLGGAQRAITTSERPHAHHSERPSASALCGDGGRLALTVRGEQQVRLRITPGGVAAGQAELQRGVRCRL